MSLRLSIAFVVLLLTACDIPGMGPDPRIAQREAEGNAIGAACRQALRGIEDCYALNEKSPKTAVYAGWREMDEYMRENKLEGQPPLHGKDRALQARSAAAAGKLAEKEEIIEDSKTKAASKASEKTATTAKADSR